MGSLEGVGGGVASSPAGEAALAPVSKHWRTAWKQHAAAAAVVVAALGVLLLLQAAGAAAGGLLQLKNACWWGDGGWM